MYIPPFTISSKAVNLVAEISNRLGKLELVQEKETQLHLRKVNRIKTIHSSLAIEGNTLSEEEVTDIINGKNIVAPLREIQEVKNAIKVYDEFHNLNPFNEKDLLRAHGIMMMGLTDDAGKYRKGGVGVYSEKGVVHMAPPASRVPELMGSLFEWTRTAKDNLLIRSCVFHYEFEFIHPFSDGNGRMGRLWQSLLLGQLNPIFSHLPVENMVYSNQQEYYDAIARSTKAGECGPFIDFMLEEILKSLDEKVTNKVTNKVTKKVADKSEFKLLDAIKKHPQITIRQLKDELRLSESGVKKIIARLTEKGMLKRVGSRKAGRWEIVNRSNTEDLQ